MLKIKLDNFEFLPGWNFKRCCKLIKLKNEIMLMILIFSQQISVSQQALKAM